MNNFKALPQLAEELQKMVASGEAQLAEVVRTYTDGTVDAKIWDGSVGRFPSTDKGLPAGQKGVLLQGFGGSKIFLPLGLPLQYAYNEPGGTVIGQGIGGVEGFYSDQSQGIILDATEWNARQLRFRVNTDVIARRDWVQANYTHYTDLDWLLRYGTIHSFSYVQMEDPVASTTSVNPDAPRWIGGLRTVWLPPGTWRTIIQANYHSTGAGPGQGYNLHLQVKGVNFYTTHYAPPDEKTYSLTDTDFEFTTVDPGWEPIGLRVGFSGAWAAGTTSCAAATMFGMFRRIG